MKTIAKLVACACAFALALVLAGCSSGGSASSSAASASASASAASASASAASASAAAASTLEDGTYEAVFSTDSSMFHVNEADEGKGVLTVENGKMTIHVRLASKKIVNVYAGLAKDAETDAANVIQPTRVRCCDSRREGHLVRSQGFRFQSGSNRKKRINN